MNAVKLLMLLILWALLSCAKAEDAKARSVWFKADLTVDAEGSPSIGEIEGVPASLAALVRGRLLQMSYVPAQSGGTPVTASATVRGKLVLTPLVGENLEMRIESVVAAPSAIRTEPIRYPPSRARAGDPGYVEAMLTIDGAGKVTDVAIVSASHRDFEQTVSAAFRNWRLTPVSPAPISAPVTVLFHMANQEPPSGQFECRLDPARPHVRGQSGCIDQLTVIAQRL